jgi:tetrahydrodipicolinate N-succinyltransferase
MPAVSKAQQRFMGMVYAVKKGEMSAPSSEVAKAAASMSKKDAKDFASTKHKKLPNKVVSKEGYTSADNAERIKRYDSEKKQFAKADRKMKFGKFYDKAKEAKDRLRPGEVKRYDKKLGKYVSNKD